MDVAFYDPLKPDGFDKALGIVEASAAGLNARQVTGDRKIVKVSLVGVGMRSHSGVAGKMFKNLADNRVNIQMIATSEIKISCVVDRTDGERALRCLHKVFGLDKKP